MCKFVPKGAQQPPLWVCKLGPIYYWVRGVNLHVFLQYMVLSSDSKKLQRKLYNVILKVDCSPCMQYIYIY